MDSDEAEDLNQTMHASASQEQGSSEGMDELTYNEDGELVFNSASEESNNEDYNDDGSVVSMNIGRPKIRNEDLASFVSERVERIKAATQSSTLSECYTIIGNQLNSYFEILNLYLHPRTLKYVRERLLKDLIIEMTPRMAGLSTNSKIKFVPSIIAKVLEVIRSRFIMVFGKKKKELIIQQINFEIGRLVSDTTTGSHVFRTSE